MINEAGIYDSKEYKKSRFAYKMECTFEYFVALLIADAYLSSLLTAIGMPDSMVGIVSSIGSLAFCFQLLTAVLAPRVDNVKRFSTIVHFIGRLFYVVLYLIPFFDFIPKAYKAVVAVVCIVLGYFGYYVVMSMIYKWGNSFVHPAKRATFSATKEMLSLICGMVFTFTMGQLIDTKYTVDGQVTEAGFVLIAITILVVLALDTMCLLIMRPEEGHHRQEGIEPVRKVIGDLFKNKGYVFLVILDCMHKAALYTVTGFMGTFKLKELAMSIGLVTIVSVISNGARLAVSKPIGRFSDKTSFATGITLGLAIMAAGYVFIVFSTPRLWWMVIMYQVLYNVSLAATNQNLMNATYSYVDKDHFVQAMSVKNCLSGVLGFFVSLGAGVMLKAIQESESGTFTLLGFDLYAQQVLAIVAFALTVVAFLFAQLVVRKQKVLVQ